MSGIAPAPAAPVHVESAAGSFRRLLARVGFGAANLSLSQIVKRAFRMGVLLFAGRLLGPAVFGEYVLLLTALELVAVISGTGYIDLLARDIARDYGLARPWLLRLTKLRLAFTLAAAGILLLGLWALRYSPFLLASAGLLLLTLFPRSLNESCQGVLRGRSQFSRLVWIEIVQGVTLAAGAFIFLSAHRGLRAIIYAEIVAAIVGALVANGVTAKFLRGTDSLAKLPPLRSALPFNVFPLIVNVYDRADVFILSKLAGDFAVGIYGIPYRIYSMLQILPYGVMGFLLPDFARTTWNVDSAIRCRRLLQGLYSAALVLILALWFIAPSLLVLVLGVNFRLSQGPMRILIWAAIPMFLNFGLNTILLASGREKLFVRTATVCTIVNLTGNLLLASRFSFIAAASLTVLTECVLLIQNLFLIRRVIGTVPLPSMFIWTSASFSALVLAGTALQRVIPEVTAGTVATFFFALACYLLMRNASKATVDRSPKFALN